jgi:hypothetical protein
MGYMTMNNKALTTNALKAFKKTGYHGTLAKSFSPKVITELLETGTSSTLTSILCETHVIESLNLNIPLGDFFDALYQHMQDSYRNEYVYKNAITQKLLLNRHSLKNSNIFSEFRVSASKADLMIVNGTCSIYEIKTDLDNLGRLNKQLNDYQEFAEFVSVVASRDQANLINDTVSEDIGILALSPNYRLRTVREPVSGLETRKLLHDTIFDSLRRSEYTSILIDAYGSIPKYPNTLVHSEYKKLFRRIDIRDIHNATLNTLKQREHTHQGNKLINKFPMSLKVFAATSNMNEKSRFELLRCLHASTKNSLATQQH